jgi:hypothetical protein
MPIDYSKLRNITARDLIKALDRHALSDTFPPKTLRSIVEGQARWDEEDVQRLGLIK